MMESVYEGNLKPNFQQIRHDHGHKSGRGSLVAESFRGENPRCRPGWIQRGDQGNPDGNQSDQRAIYDSRGESYVVDRVNLGSERQQVIVASRPGERVADYQTNR